PGGQVDCAHRYPSHGRTVRPASSFCTPAVTTSWPGLTPPDRTTVSCRYSRTSTGVRVRPPVGRSTTHTAGRSPVRRIEESGRTYPGAASAGARWTVAVIPRTILGPAFWIVNRAWYVRVTGSAVGESSRRAAGYDTPGAAQRVTVARAVRAATAWFSGRLIIASRSPSRASLATTWPSATTCPASAGRAVITPSASAVSSQYESRFRARVRASFARSRRPTAVSRADRFFSHSDKLTAPLLRRRVDRASSAVAC